MKKKRIWKPLLLTLLVLILAGTALIFGMNAYVVQTTKDQVVYTVTTKENEISPKVLGQLKDKKADCVLVLGAKVRRDGTPSYMLQDRLDVGIKLYKEGIVPKILLSGDHGQKEYDEVNVMKAYALDAGVPKKDIFLDHAGFATYESVYRAKEIFQVDKMIVATQGYHQYRTLYGCNKMEIEAWGIGADQTTYRGQKMRDLREIAARDKDVIKWMWKPDPTYLGDTIPISGSGIQSQD